MKWFRSITKTAVLKMKIHYFGKITLEVYLLSGMENSKRYKIQNRDSEYSRVFILTNLLMNLGL